jgi:predicted histidine transporter YuiF (NhaC family)
VERSTTSKTVEEPVNIVCVKDVGDVGTPATLDSFAPTVGIEMDRKRFMFDTWIDHYLVRVSLGMSTLKKGALVAVEEGPPQ